MRATREYSLLYCPDEVKVGVDEDHSNMVKFGGSTDRTYQKVVRVLGECLDSTFGG